MVLQQYHEYSTVRDVGLLEVCISLLTLAQRGSSRAPLLACLLRFPQMRQAASEGSNVSS